MADWSGFLNKSSGFVGGSTRNEDFDEEEVWGVTMEREREKVYLSPKMRLSKESSGSSAWPISPSPRKIPSINSVTPHSLESDSDVVKRSSAPIDIPDWSKIYGKKGVEEGVNKKLDCGYGDGYNDDDYGDGDDEDDMIPPHEWIARKLARSQISSFSVCEGIGRTLKGRDLSKVRNAILTKTGFIE